MKLWSLSSAAIQNGAWFRQLGLSQWVRRSFFPPKDSASSPSFWNYSTNQRKLTLIRWREQEKVWDLGLVLLLVVDTTSPSSDQHQFSPNNINTLSKEKVMRFNTVITSGKMLWSSIKFSQLIFQGNVWRWVWRMCMWISVLKVLCLNNHMLKNYICRKNLIKDQSGFPWEIKLFILITFSFVEWCWSPAGHSKGQTLNRWSPVFRSFNVIREFEIGLT